MGKGSYTGGSTVIVTRNNNIRSVSTLKRTLNSALTSIQITEKRLLTNAFTKNTKIQSCTVGNYDDWIKYSDHCPISIKI